MSERHWTPMQRHAIDTRDRTLLVSAAAGSGKTAVLTERIISSILDPQNPGDISRMLIVTFTNAAAAELRSRIASALQEALNERPNNRHLETQLLLLPSADIRTIDAFCAKFLRRHASKAGISHRFRVADDAEGELIARSIMEELLNDCYEGRGFTSTPDGPTYSESDFLLLADALTGIREPQETLSSTLLNLYRKCQNFPEGCRLLIERANTFEKELKIPYTQTAVFQSIARYLQMGFHHYNDLLTAGFEKIIHALTVAKKAQSPEDFESPDVQWASKIVKKAATICSVLLRELVYSSLIERSIGEGDLEGARRLLSDAMWNENPPLTNTHALKFLKDARSGLYAFQKEAAYLLAFSDADFQKEAPRLSRAINQLGAFLVAFEERFLAEKRRRNICEYSDLERLTLALLSDESGEPTPIAAAQKEEYDAVYVDEYQDVNEVQHRIVSCLSSPRNLFMVGDIKQSIYRFRGAEPSIFASLRKEFASFDRHSSASAQSIFMQSNFRCDPPIIHFTNHVFDVLMKAAGDSIGYHDGDKLFVGKKLPDNAFPAKVEILLADAANPSKKDRAVQETAEIPSDFSPEKISSARAEAFVIANQIAHLLQNEKKNDGTPILPSDIAILLRSTRDTFTQVLIDELGKHNIPCEASENTDFFLNPDVLLMLSLLNVINNPQRDIYLAGVLRSPLFNFTMDDLVSIRSEGGLDLSLYESLSVYFAQHPENEKCHFFFEKLELYRTHSERLPVWRLLRFLYEDTAILSMSDASSSDRARDNLRMLYHYARTFEGSSFQGLYSFLQYINRIIREGKQLPMEKSDGSVPNAVRLMTIHASKGLEFPVCFIAETAKKLEHRNQSPLIFSSEFGAAFKLRTSEGFGIVDNPLFHAITLCNEEKECEENLRILYVALTRASERLYITGDAHHAESLFCPSKEPKIDRFSVLSAPSFLSLILGTIPYSKLNRDEKGLPEGCFLSFDDYHVSKISVSSDDLGNMILFEEQVDNADTERRSTAKRHLTDEILQKRFNFVYPYQDVTSLPGKLSVSHLHPDILDEQETDPVISLDENKGKEGASIRPAFLLEEQTVSGAEKGTATHLFMQFCRFDLLKKFGVDAELQSLIDLRFISKQDAALVRKSELEKFIRSSLFENLCQAKKVHRELRFHASLPASAFTNSEKKKEALSDETLFIQGVIDCVAVYEDGSYDLIDYKTDRLPRNRDDAVALLRSRHATQLSYYGEACTKIFGHPPRSLIIYALQLGEAIEITPIDLAMTKLSFTQNSDL